MASKEQMEVATSCRLQMMLVCRQWAPIGTRILWSHLYLRPWKFQSIINVMTKCPQYGLYVKRITVKASPNDLKDNIVGWKMHEEMYKLGGIFSLCPNLHIYNGPITGNRQTQEAFPMALKHLRFQLFGPMVEHSSNAALISWLTNLTSLNLVFSRPIALPINVNLPKLLSLSVAQLEPNSSVETALDGWQLPSLQTLAVFGGGARRVVWLPIVRTKLFIFSLVWMHWYRKSVCTI